MTALDLLREMFEDGPVHVAFAGNPLACEDLERRIRDALAAAPAEPSVGWRRTDRAVLMDTIIEAAGWGATSGITKAERVADAILAIPSPAPSHGGKEDG